MDGKDVYEDYYQVGGSLEYQHPTYVERQADYDLYHGLKNGNYCYVLNSRQMGKSSLRVQVMKRLRQEGTKCASIDITGIGSSVTATEWYGAFVSELLRGFSLTRKVDFKSWWHRHQDLTPTQRLKEFIEDVLFKQFSQDIVIFIDEIDSILRTGFKDDFFAFIRACYNCRVDDPEYKRLTFCLLGVATPSTLIQNKDRTSFNIGQAIELTGFELESAKCALLPGLVEKVENPTQVLAEILFWTGGQPFLTQKICRLVHTLATPIINGTEADRITQLIQDRILENWEAQDEPEHLRTIRDRILRNQKQAGQLLGLYQQILSNETWNANQPKRVYPATSLDIYADSSPEQMELRLTGLVIIKQGRLQVHNRIYAEVFNQRWVEQVLAELRPYATALTAWLESGEDEAYLLRGQVLLNAQDWAANKHLSAQDYRFLAASQELAKREVQAILTQEQQASLILAEANRKATQRIRTGSTILSFCLALAVVAGALAGSAFYKQRQARLGTRLEQAGVSALRQFEFRQLEALLSAVQTGRELQALVGKQKSLQKYPATSPLYALQRILDQIREKNQLPGHQGRILAVSFSPNGQLFASAGQDHVGQGSIVQLWNTKRQPVATLKGHTGWIRQISFSPDGQRLATAGFDGVRVWQRSGQQIAYLTGHQGSVMAVAFSPDGQTLATAGQDRSVRLWNLQGQQIKSWKGHRGEIHTISFSPDGTLIATGGLDGVRLWNRAGTAVKAFAQPQGWITSVSFRPDGKLLATAGVNGAFLWNRAGQKVADFTRHQSKVNQISFSPDGLVVATVGNDGVLRLWNEKEQLAEFKGHQGKVNSFSFSSDGQMLATAGNDGTLRLWERFRSGREFGGRQDKIYSIRFNADGHTLATAGQNRTVRLWSRLGKPLAVFSGLQGRVLSVDFSPNGQLIAAGGFEETVRIWRLNGSKDHLIQELKGHTGGAFSVSFSPNGQRLAVGGERAVRVWNVNGKLLLNLEEAHTGRVKSVSFSPDGDLLATAGSEGMIRLWNRRGEKVNELKHPVGTVHSVRFSPDGQLATSGSEGSVYLWSREGNLMQELKGHAGSVYQVDFSSDGQTIATSGSEGTVRLWNRTGTLLAEYGESKAGEIYGISFNPNGDVLATAGADGMVRLWEVEDLDQLLEDGCRWLQDYLKSHPDAPQVCDTPR